MKNIIILFMLLCFAMPAKAQEWGTDKYAHMGVSYMMTTFFYGFYQRGFGMPRTTAYIFAAFVTTFATTFKECLDRNPDGGDIIANGIGIGLSGITIATFNF